MSGGPAVAVVVVHRVPAAQNRGRATEAYASLPSSARLRPPDRVVWSQVDVEGFEPVVFKSGEALMASGRVANVLLEYSPGVCVGGGRARFADVSLSRSLRCKQIRHLLVWLASGRRVSCCCPPRTCEALRKVQKSS